MCTQLSLRKTRVRTRLALYNTRIHIGFSIYNIHVHLIYMKLCIGNPRVFLVYATIVLATRIRLLKMSKNTSFEFWVVWVVMKLTSSVVTTFSYP